jgi:hypothetical protein
LHFVGQFAVSPDSVHGEIGSQVSAFGQTGQGVATRFGHFQKWARFGIQLAELKEFVSVFTR